MTVSPLFSVNEPENSLLDSTFDAGHVVAVAGSHCIQSDALIAPPQKKLTAPDCPIRARTALMSSVVSQTTALVAGLALLSAGFIIFPRNGLRGLAKAMAISISLAVVAAIVMMAARSFAS